MRDIFRCARIAGDRDRDAEHNLLEACTNATVKSVSPLPAGAADPVVGVVGGDLLAFWFGNGLVHGILLLRGRIIGDQNRTAADTTITDPPLG